VNREARRPPGAYPGQMLILVAAAMIALIGILGLAIDLGVSMTERRTMQNAADAGALAGARVVAKAAATSGLKAFTDVQSVVDSNHMVTGLPTINSCSYVDDTDKVVGDCADGVPSTATGVRVRVSEQHPTFFLRIMPGGPKTASTGATAIAHVQEMTNVPADGPFLVCGVATKLAAGGSMNILTQSDGSWLLNEAAVGQTFIIHAPQVNQCGSQSNSFKGFANGSANRGLTVPGWFGYSTGDAAGQVSASVSGIQGCQAGQPVVNCVALLPVAVANPPDNGNKQLWTVAIMAFYITQPNSNTHYGVLMGAYTVSGGGQDGWNGQYTGPIVVRLTE